MAAGLLARLSVPLHAATAREVFALLARDTKDLAGLDYKASAPPAARCPWMGRRPAPRRGPDPWPPRSLP